MRRTLLQGLLALITLAAASPAGAQFDGAPRSGGDPKWANYEMPLVSEDPQLWAIGVRLEDLDSGFGKLLKEMSVDWHKSGKLLALENKWGIKQSPYLIETNKKLKSGT